MGVPVLMPPAAAASVSLEESSKAARVLGQMGGRPKGSRSSSLAAWLRREVAQRRAEGYSCREAFVILRDTEDPDGDDALTLKDWTSDKHGVEPNARVSWAYFKRLWYEKN
ncbi:hypothetical protein AZSI13_31310 [Azospira sp. I13]|nr:hypothetical protein AZSI13_31310 [Azospira sp. I13]